jgi:hypothetical protein
MPRDTAPDAPPLPEILRSKSLARILTPILWEMLDRAYAEAEAHELGRYMAEPLRALRAMTNEIRTAHGLRAIHPEYGVPDEPDESNNNGQAEPAAVKS